MEVESGGDINAVGDSGRSIGPFQIQRGYWEDAVQQDSSLTEGGKSYESCRGEGSVEYSKRVMQVGLGLGLGLKEGGRVVKEKGVWSIPRELCSRARAKDRARAKGGRESCKGEGILRKLDMQVGLGLECRARIGLLG